MNNKYLVINCGSSSLKFSLYEMPSEIEKISGYVEKIGYEDSFWTVKINGEKKVNNRYLLNHIDAVNVMIDELFENGIIKSLDEIKGIGHRVLHGGEYYNDSVEITDLVLDKIVSLTNLGPLHLPGQIAGIKAMMERMPQVRQVSVFDTAFHQTIPKENYMYALPYEWYTKYGIRKYGFHGISHKYITEVMKSKLNKVDVNLIICHIGSGASISCIKNGKCFDTTMGLTPLDGLIMGTRSGNIDPSIIEFIMKNTNMELNDVMNSLNKESGLLGICGKNDFRDVVSLKNNNNERAILAYEMFMNSIIKYIAEYYFKLEGSVDAVVFTAGVLENNIKLREDIIQKLSNTMNISINKSINNNIGYGCDNKEGIITSLESKVPFYVMPTSEEVMILRDTYNILNN